MGPKKSNLGRQTSSNRQESTKKKKNENWMAKILKCLQKQKLPMIAFELWINAKARKLSTDCFIKNIIYPELFVFVLFMKNKYATLEIL